MQTAIIRRQTVISGGGLSQAPGTSPAPQQDQQFDTPPNSRSIIVGSTGNLRAQPLWSYIEDFAFLPATAAAAGSAMFLKSVAVGTAVVTRAAKGGVNIKTQATTPATNDKVLLTAIASSGQIVPVTAISMPSFHTRINLTQIVDQTATVQVTGAVPANGGSGYVVGDVLTVAGGTLSGAAVAATLKVTAVVNGPAPNFVAGVISTLTVVNASNYSTGPTSPNTVTGGTGTLATITLTTASSFGGMFASAGLHQTTSVIVPNTAANDEVLFLYDPLQVYSTLAESTADNWICVQNLAGTVTYVDSGVAVVAGVDVQLAIAFDSSRIPHFYINGQEVGSGFVAATSAVTLIPCVGEQITATSPTGQIDMDVRFLTVERFAG